MQSNLFDINWICVLICLLFIIIINYYFAYSSKKKFESYSLKKNINYCIKYQMIKLKKNSVSPSNKIIFHLIKPNFNICIIIYL